MGAGDVRHAAGVDADDQQRALREQRGCRSPGGPRRRGALLLQVAGDQGTFSPHWH